MPNVILADNDAKRRNKLARALEKAHYTVRTAVDAPNALEEVRAARPDILVLDWRRPRTESRRQILLALFAECKERFPVLALAEAIDKARDALAHGAQDYVRKPVDTAELVERVERMLRNAGAVGPQADRGRPKLSIGLSELHNAESGRIDASNVSVYLGVSLADLARAVGANYKTIHKTPDAEAIQDGLAPIKRSLEILDDVFGNATSVRIWLNSKHPDLGMRTPLQALMNGGAEAVQGMLENAYYGIPS